MNLVSKIEGFFQSLGSHIKNAFVSLFGSQTGEKLAQAAEEWAKTEIGQVSLTVVQGLEHADLTSAAKASTAFDQIVQALAAQGKTLPTSAIKFAIEFALQIIRGAAVPAA
jgi:hypothetical protein